MKPLLLALTLALSLTAPAVAAPAPAVPFSTVSLPSSQVAMYALEDPRLPRVWYDLRFEAGERYVPANLAGMSALAAEVLNRGPASIPYGDYRQELFRLGAEINWKSDNRFLTAQVKSRPEHLARVTALVRQSASEPRLDEETFQQLKARLVGQRRAMNDDMSTIIFHYGSQKLWEFRPESRRTEGWVESLSKIERAELFGFLRTQLAAPETYVAAAGPMPASSLASTLEAPLAGWAKPFVAEPAAFPATGKQRAVVLIDKPGATDNQIVMLAPHRVSLTSGEAAAAEVFLAGMGYGLGARLGKTLRVERGLTYHASSGLRRGEWPSWYAYSFGGNEQAPKIVSGLYELFDQAKTGLSAEETARAKDQLLKSLATGMETPAEQIDAVAGAVGIGLPASYPFMRKQLIEGVTPAQVNAQAKRIAGLEGMVLFVMGDAATIKGPLAKALPAGTPIEVKSFEAISSEARAASK